MNTPVVPQAHINDLVSTSQTAAPTGNPASNFIKMLSGYASPQNGDSALTRFGNTIVNAGKTIVGGLAKPGQQLGESLGTLAGNGMVSQGNKNLADQADMMDNQAIQFSKSGDKDKAQKLFKLAQETRSDAAKGFDQQNTDLQNQQGNYQRGVVGAAAELAPSALGATSILGQAGAGALAGAGAGYSNSTDKNQVQSTLGGAALGGITGAALGGIGKLLGGNAGSAVAGAEGEAPSALTGRAATGAIGAANPESVTQSEQLATKALQMTKSNSIRGMAKELEESVPKIGQQITSTAKAIDAKIGVQPADTALEAIMSPVESSDAAFVNKTQNPQLIQKVQNEVSNLIQGKDADFVMPAGQTQEGMTATSVNQLNEARKALNSRISRGWFEAGMPQGTPQNDLNMMRWKAANAIKDYIGNTSGAEGLADLIDQQHTALSTSPTLARQALSGTRDIPIQNMPSHMINKVIGSGKIPVARALANGTGQTGLGSALGGAIQSVAKTGLPSLAAVNSAAGNQQGETPPSEAIPTIQQTGNLSNQTGGVQSAPGRYSIPNINQMGILTGKDLTEKENALTQQIADAHAASDTVTESKLTGQLAQLQNSSGAQKSIQDESVKANTIMATGNRAVSLIQEAPVSLLNLNGSFDSLMNSTDPKYAALGTALQNLQKLTGVDISSATSKETLISKLDEAMNVSQQPLNAAISQYYGGNTLNANTPPNLSSLPPVQNMQPQQQEQIGVPVDYHGSFVSKAGKGGGGLPPITRSFFSSH